MDKENRKHFLSPNFVSDVEKKRGSLSPKYICDNLWKYFKNTRLCTYEQLFIPICRKNHWYLIILNIHAKRIKLLDSLIDGRKKRMDAFIEKLVNVLSTVIGIQERRPSVDMTEFEFVVPEVVQQLNPTDCGIFVMKFMQLWSNDGISRAITNVLYSVIQNKEEG
ncbi:uncharacterized protein LOC104881308 [Vitis vinifera]|uniref:uncharacterized protein LOC104881308 n=1 Tax=Vitis vinifera TaxID=29760 RepID=UPI0028834F01|nr:uncharacterized protein LOC104881308 [Vitis vinifera]